MANGNNSWQNFSTFNTNSSILKIRNFYKKKFVFSLGGKNRLFYKKFLFTNNGR
jgi:hypothetical protein